ISSLCTRKEDQYQHDDAATVPEGKDKPQLLKTEMGESFIGQFMKFDNDNQMLEIKDQNTMNKDIYVFAAVRNNTENLENPRDITFITISGTNQEIEVPVVYGADRVGEWIIIKKSINNAQGNNFEIGGPYADIAEIVVYNNTPSNGEIEEIKNYFLSKYRTNVLVDNGTTHIIDIESED
ncbi:MAG TPA: hypothetical protein VFD17_02425, partial [Clostridia bacterium]|nr:hypothetical protein [Clostridia bacterium]